MRDGPSDSYRVDNIGAALVRDRGGISDVREIVERVLDRILDDRPGPRSITVTWVGIPIAGPGRLGLSPAACCLTSFARANPWKMSPLKRLMGGFATSVGTCISSPRWPRRR